MRPTFAVTSIEGAITGPSGRALKLVLTEEVYGLSDKITLEVDDRDGVLPIPQPGMIVGCEMGYLETGMMFMGNFQVRKVTLIGWPRFINIEADAAYWYDSEHKAPRSFDFHGAEYPTVCSIIYKLAERGGYTSAKCDPEFEKIPNYYLSQSYGESDAHLLNRLRRNFGAVAKVHNGQLLFLKGGNSIAHALTRPGDGEAVYPDNVIHYEATFDTRPEYMGSAAPYVKGPLGETPDAHAPGVGTPEAGGGGHAPGIGPEYKEGALLPNLEEEATAVAAARAEQLHRATGNLLIRLIGDPKIAAGCILSVIKVRQEVDGPWWMTKVSHVIDNNGFITDIEASLSNEEAGAPGGTYQKPELT